MLVDMKLKLVLNDDIMIHWCTLYKCNWFHLIANKRVWLLEVKLGELKVQCLYLITG